MKLTGVFAPLPTLFDDRDEVSPARMRKVYPRWVASPLTGFVVLGTNSEFGLLDDDESERVVGEARALVPSTKTLIAGATRESTQAAVKAVKRAAELGADAVMVRTPCFFKSQMSGDALFRHYSVVADASPVPVLLYNFTAVTGVNLLPVTVARLAEHPNIVGIKESGSDLAQISDLVTMTPEEFSVLAGSGSTFFQALTAGVSGGILGLGGVLPEHCVRLFELVARRLFDDARALQEELLPIARMISTGYGVPGLKAALNVLGLDVGQPRPPLLPVGDAALTALRDVLARFQEVKA